MKRATKIGITLGAALSLGLGAAAVSADPYGYGRGGYMHGSGGMGPGMMGGGGPGYGMGPGMMGGGGPGYGMGWGGGHMGGGGRGMGSQGMFGGYYGNVDDSLAALKDELRITPQQDAAWQAFSQNAKQQNENRQAWFDKMRQSGRASSAPEVMAQRTEFMRQRQAEMEASATALKNLYATLTPEQKTIADQRFGGYGPGWAQGNRGGPRSYAR